MTRLTIQVYHADLEQAEQLARVKSNIAPLIVEWFNDQAPGTEFYMSQLTRHVWESMPWLAPDSPRRIMAALKGDGKVRYELVSRKLSLYRVTAAESK